MDSREIISRTASLAEKLYNLALVIGLLYRKLAEEARLFKMVYMLC